jgi:hypothetical protein
VKAGFSMGCSVLITFAKIVATGLSLGTGIIGGHFWGPLFAGCTASHFLTEFSKLLDRHTGFGGALGAYPCVTMLCTMGSAHVVSFRAHTAIMLILTLTISAFDDDDSSAAGGGKGTAGDYSAGKFSTRSGRRCPFEQVTLTTNILQVSTAYLTHLPLLAHFSLLHLNCDQSSRCWLSPSSFR